MLVLLMNLKLTIQNGLCYLIGQAYSSDESHFEIGGLVIEKNSRIWREENPRIIDETFTVTAGHCLVRTMVRRCNWLVLLCCWWSY